jgi:dienelactone hydrolase
MHRTAALVLSLLIACGDNDDGNPGPDAGTPPDLSVEAAGPHAVGTRWSVETEPNSGRDLTVQVWYPATGGAADDYPIQDLLDEPQRTTYADLLAAADPACPNRRGHATVDAPPLPGPFPLVAFSHCHECTRFSALTIAKRLASHGFVVVSVDHTGNTLWNQLAGDGLPLAESTLALRVDDLSFAIEVARGGVTSKVEPIAASIDPDPARSGVFGHSFGAVTVGLYAQRNAIGAAFALAAPMENPLLPGVDVAMISEPLGFLVAREDNSITELGNNLIRSNFEEAPGAAWKIEVADAGHWSVSDLVGVVDGFDPGCGAGERQTDGQPFTYLDAATGRAIASAYVTAFFRHTLLGEAGAGAYLDSARPAGTVIVGP